MLMSPSLRKLALTTHVTSSVGWFGSVAAFLALALAGLTSAESETVRAAYVAMHLTTWYVIVPLALASFSTGLIEGFGTPWGLFRHYWVTVKFVLTIFATALLLVHTQPIDRIAAIAAQATVSTDDLWQLRLQLVGDASAALFVLALTTVLSIYKPWGMTAYGLKEQSDERRAFLTRKRHPMLSERNALIGLAMLLGLIVLLHLFGVGLHAD